MYDKCCFCILACVCPPLAVCMFKGFCTSVCFGACCLTLVGYIPGCCYACCVAINEGNEHEEISVKEKTIINQPAATPANIVINIPPDDEKAAPQEATQDASTPAAQEE